MSKQGSGVDPLLLVPCSERGSLNHIVCDGVTTMSVTVSESVVAVKKKPTAKKTNNANRRDVVMPTTLLLLLLRLLPGTLQYVSHKISSILSSVHSQTSDIYATHEQGATFLVLYV